MSIILCEKQAFCVEVAGDEAPAVEEQQPGDRLFATGSRTDPHGTLWRSLTRRNLAVRDVELVVPCVSGAQGPEIR